MLNFQKAFYIWSDYQAEIQNRHEQEKPKINTNEWLSPQEKSTSLLQLQMIEEHFNINQRFICHICFYRHWLKSMIYYQVGDMLYILMVQRMIGQRVGTGGSTGQQYLMHAMQSRKVFSDHQFSIVFDTRFTNDASRTC